MNIMASNFAHAGTYDAHLLRERIERLDRLSRLLDIAFIVPGTNIRFGAEAIMRLVPGIGDAAASALSSLILYEAHRLGVSRRILIRMAGNIAIEALAGSVPIVGDLFDVAFRANRRNVQILREYFGL
jgi:C4-dicarboxylate transporter